VLSGEVTDTKLIVFGLTRLGFEAPIYRTQGEHANHYTTGAVAFVGAAVLYETHRKNKRIKKMK
jgi:hypothetical protein